MQNDRSSKFRTTLGSYGVTLLKTFAVQACLFFSLAFSFKAQAAQTVNILDERATTSDDPYSVSANFVVNNKDKDQARVWIEVDIEGGYWDADLHREEIALKNHFMVSHSISQKTRSSISRKGPSNPLSAASFRRVIFLGGRTLIYPGVANLLQKSKSDPMTMDFACFRSLMSSSKCSSNDKCRAASYELRCCTGCSNALFSHSRQLFVISGKVLALWNILRFRIRTFHLKLF